MTETALFLTSDIKEYNHLSESGETQGEYLLYRCAGRGALRIYKKDEKGILRQTKQRTFLEQIGISSETSSYREWYDRHLGKVATQDLIKMQNVDPAKAGDSLKDTWEASRPQRRDNLRKLTRPARLAKAWANIYAGNAISAVAETLKPNSHEGKDRRKELLVMALGSTAIGSGILYVLGLNPFESHGHIAQTLSPDFLPTGSGVPRAPDAINQAINPDFLPTGSGVPRAPDALNQVVSPPAHNGQELTTLPEAPITSGDTNVAPSHSVTVEGYQAGAGIKGLDRGTVEEMVTSHFKEQFGELPTPSQTLAAEKYFNHFNGLDFDTARLLQPGDVLKMPKFPEWILNK